MTIRRFREHVAAQNWFAVLIDIGIVVLGVFLGTQVNNWNEGRIDASRADEYRRRLADELEFDMRQYSTQATYYRLAKAYGLRALASLERKRKLSDDEFLIAAYQLTQIDTTRAKTGVFEEMAVAGLTDRLGDAETQQLGSDFYLTAEVAQRLNEEVLPYRTQLREVMPYAIQSEIRARCGDRNVMYKSRIVGVRLVVPCKVELDPLVVADAIRAIRAAPDIERQMTRYIASLDEKFYNFDLAHDQAGAFRTKLLEAPGTPAG